MKRIVELKERNYADASTHADAPVNYEDAIENYKRILDITGDITANIIAPNSEAVDLEGPHLIDNRMHYASKTLENIEATRQAGLWGVSMPRRYGGLNLPNVVFSMMSESPLVIKRFTPFNRQQFSFSSKVALSITRWRSEPASGSVRSIDIISPSQIRGIYF